MAVWQIPSLNFALIKIDIFIFYNSLVSMQFLTFYLEELNLMQTT
jgi:hypothetical protein